MFERTRFSYSLLHVLTVVMSVATASACVAEDAPNFTEVITLPAKQGSIVLLSFSPDSKVLTSGSNNGQEKTWEVGSWVCSSAAKDKPATEKVSAKSADGNITVSINEDTVAFVDRSGSGAAHSGKLERGKFVSVALSSDCRFAATASSAAGFPKDRDRFVKVWDVATGKLVTSLVATADKPRAVAFSPDGNYLAGAGNDSRIKIWQITPPLRPIEMNAAKQPEKAEKEVPQVAFVTVKPATIWEPGARRKLWLLAIGVSQYENNIVPPLPYARSDGEKVRDWALSLSGGHVEQKNVSVLFDEQATRKRVLQQIDWLRKQAIEEDAVVVYFALHGAPDLDPDGRSVDAKYLVLYDTDPKDLFSTGFSLDELSDKMKLVKAKTQVLILEACYAGPVGEEVMKKTPTADLELRPRLIQKMGQEGGRVVLSASSGRQMAICSEEIKGALFTHYLLKAWGTGTGRLLTDGFDEARDAVRRAANQLGSTQEPAKYGDQNIDVTFSGK
jgi:WD40 repeat protein